MRFLLYKWKVFNQEDIKAALERAGHEVHVFNAVDFVREKQEEIENMLAEKFAGYDIVFSVNYFQEVSGACMKAGKKYISWTVDSPMLTMYHDSVYNPCNYIFIFDKFNYMQFKAIISRLQLIRKDLSICLKIPNRTRRKNSAPIFHLSEDCMTRIRMMIFMKAFHLI